MDADNGRDIQSHWLRADKKVVITRVIACANFRRGNPIWACTPTRFVHFPATYFARANIGKHEGMPGRPRFWKWFAMFYFCNTKAISTRSLFVKNAYLSTSSMEYSSWLLLNRVTVASSAASTILNLSGRRVDAVKSGSLRCADEFK